MAKTDLPDLNAHNSVWVISVQLYGILFITSSKKKMWDFIIERPEIKPERISNYWTFSQVLKGKSSDSIECKSTWIIINRHRLDYPLHGLNYLKFKSDPNS